MAEPVTAREAYLAEILGDVGKLDDQVKDLQGQLVALRTTIDQQVDESLRLLQATADATKQQVAVLRRIEPGLGRRWVLPASVAAAIILSVGASSALVWWAAGKRDQAAIVQAAGDPAHCARLGGAAGVADQRSYCAFFSPPPAATGGQSQ